MNKFQFRMVGALITVALLITLFVQRQTEARLLEENRALRENGAQLAKLTAQNERLSRMLAKANSAAMPRLPAPRIQAGNSPEQVAESVPHGTVISQVLRGENAPKLTAEQIESYMNENRRSAASLLAASRTSEDPSLLKEAMEKYPHDPQVAFAAVFKRDAMPEERRLWLEAFKQAAPENSLASYLSAMDYFKSGQADKAVQEISAAAGRPHFEDYSMEFIQSSEEAYRAAGYSVAEAKALASSQLLLPQLAELRDLSRNMIDLAKSYRQAGDEPSAQASLQMDSSLGQRLQEAPGQALISKLVGIAIEQMALSAMDPAAPYGNSGETVKNRLEELSQQRAAIKQTGQQFESFQQRISEQDWISYSDRWRLFGEQAASQWLVSKYGQK